MRAWLAVGLLVGCRGDAPAPGAPPPEDAATTRDAAIAMPTSEAFARVGLAGLSDDGTRAILESIPGVPGPRERIVVDLATMHVVERGALAEEIPGSTLRRIAARAPTGEPTSGLADGEVLVAGTWGYTGQWRRNETGLIVLLHQVGLPTCFVRVAGARAVWRHCVAPGVALDAALSPHGLWGVWTTRDPLEDFMRIHTWNLTTDTAGPVTAGLGVPVISDGGRVVVRGASESCEVRGETALVCFRDQRLSIEPLP